MWLFCTASNGHNRTLALTLQEMAQTKGARTQLLDLVEANLPLYTPDRDEAGAPAGLAPIQEMFRTATAFVFCAPEYNGSIPPTLTNAIAWLSTQTDDFRALFNTKPVIIATRSGGGGQKVLVAMRLQFSHLGCNVLGREILTTGKKPLNPDSAHAVLDQLSLMDSSIQ